MSSIPLVNIREARLAKIASLRSLGLNPFRATSARTHYIAPLLSDYEKHENTRVTVAGRLMSWRKQGSVSFGHIQDQTGTIQLLLKRQSVAATDPARGTLGYDSVNLLDVGDIVEGTGTVGKSQRGEISVMIEDFRVLTKSLRPMPDQWSGMKDRELILRKRYLDTILEPDSKNRFAAVAGIIQAVRVFLIDRGFLEFPTPNIQPQYGGGTAKPFLTHQRARMRHVSLDRARTVLEALDRGGIRQGLHDRPLLPQRRHRPQPSSGVLARRDDDRVREL